MSALFVALFLLEEALEQDAQDEGEEVLDRPDRVRVRTQRDVVTIPWASRERLLDRLRTLEGARGITDAFEAVGVTHAVTLTDEDAGLLLQVVESWLGSDTIDALPEGIWDRRCALADKLHT